MPRKVYKVSIRQSVSPGNPLHCLRFYFNCAYYLGLFPFRFTFSPQLGQYVLSTNRIQKVIWVIVCILTICGVIFYAKSEYDLQRRSGRPRGPDLYFRRVSLLTDGVLFAILLTTQLTGADKLLKVFNTLHASSTYNSMKPKRFRILWITFLFMSLISVSVTTILLYFAFVAWDFDAGLDLIKNHGIEQFFLTGIIPELGYISRLVFVPARILTVVSYTLYMGTGDLLLLISCFVMNDCLNSLARQVDNPEITGMEVYREFLSLKTLTTRVNAALGLLIFGSVFGLLPYFVVTFASFVNPENLWDVAMPILEFTVVYWFLGFAAYVGRKANLVMDKFIHVKDLSDLSLFQLSALLHDVDSHLIEYNCAGFCNISPGFVGRILQLLLTFSVILIQFEMPNEK